MSGNIDVAYSNVGFSGLNKETSTVRREGQTVSSLTTASTSMIVLKAEEDLGTGMKATAYVELDPRVGMADGGTSGTSYHSRFVGISGNFGAVKLGSIDSAAVIANGQQSPLGTGVGSGYAILQSNVFAATRYNRAVKYESPVMSGFSGSVYYAPGIQADGTTNVAYAGLPMQRKTTELGLAYANGPFAASLVNIATASADGSSAAGTVAPISYATAATNPSTSTNLLTATYALGSSSFHAGYNKGKTLGTAESTSGAYYAPALAAGLDTKGSRFGYKYVAGQYDFIVQTGQQKISTTTAATAYTTRKVNGFRVVNNLSKTAAVYVGVETYNSGADLAANNTANADGGKYTVTSFGIKKAF